MAESGAAGALKGTYRDVLHDDRGRVVWRSGVQSNVIRLDARKLLSAFVHGPPVTSQGVQGMLVGRGLAAWDATGAPVPDETVPGLSDPSPFTVPRTSLTLRFLDPVSSAGVAAPTRKLEIVATIGPNTPPAANLPLREFALLCLLDGGPLLFNYRRHQAIAKDPTSTLVRTVWLVF